MRRRLLLALLAPAVLLLPGCFAVESSFVVNEDGSGTQTMRLAIPAEVASSFGEELPSTDEIEGEPEMATLREALGEDGNITFFSSNEEGIGFELTISVGPSDDFSGALDAKFQELAAAMPADSEEGLGGLLDMASARPAIVRDGDIWSFDLAEASLDPTMFATLAGGEEAAGFAGMFLEQTTITYRVSLPGEVTEHNADEVLEDGTLVWNLTGADAPRALMARSDIGGGGLSTVAMAGLLIAGIAVIAGIGGYLLFGRRRATV